METGAALTLGAVLAAGFGLIIGSFLNVVIARVPEGRSVVRPGSACPECDAPIGPRDNVPVLSWLLLRGRARCCGTRISVRYPLVEALTGVAFALVLLRFGLSWELPGFLYLAAISIALSAIDLDVFRLPNAIVLPSYPVCAALLVLAAIGDGDPRRLIRVGIAGAALYAFYFLLLAVYPRGMGFGDVKLAGLLGMYLGWLGWGPLVVGGFLGFLYGGVFGLVLVVAGRAGRKTMIPFGPYMIAGAWTAVFVGGAVSDWYLHRLTG